MLLDGPLRNLIIRLQPLFFHFHHSLNPIRHLALFLFFLGLSFLEKPSSPFLPSLVGPPLIPSYCPFRGIRSVQRRSFTRSLTPAADMLVLASYSTLVPTCFIKAARYVSWLWLILTLRSLEPQPLDGPHILLFTAVLVDY